MPRKIPPFDLNDAIRRYRAGEPARQIASTIGVSVDTVHRRLKAAGVPTQRLRNGDEPVWLDEAVAMFQSGDFTQREIGEKFGVLQAVVSKWLLRRGVRADLSEAQYRKSQRMTRAQRMAMTAGAHEAVRGMTRSEEDLIKRAIGKQARLSHATAEEIAVADALTVRGIDPVIPQKAFRKYNLDIGAFPVAVELFGGGWHAHGRHAARLPQRVKDLADGGWNLLIVWTRADIHPLSIGTVADEVLAYHELSRLDPSFRRQYRVIWGDGKFIAEGCVDDDKLTLVPAGIRGTYARG